MWRKDYSIKIRASWTYDAKPEIQSPATRNPSKDRRLIQSEPVKNNMVKESSAVIRPQHRQMGVLVRQGTWRGTPEVLIKIMIFFLCFKCLSGLYMYASKSNESIRTVLLVSYQPSETCSPIRPQTCSVHVHLYTYVWAVRAVARRETHNSGSTCYETFWNRLRLGAPGTDCIRARRLRYLNGSSWSAARTISPNRQQLSNEPNGFTFTDSVIRREDALSSATTLSARRHLSRRARARLDPDEASPHLPADADLSHRVWVVFTRPPTIDPSYCYLHYNRLSCVEPRFLISCDDGALLCMQGGGR